MDTNISSVNMINVNVSKGAIANVDVDQNNNCISFMFACDPFY